MDRQPLSATVSARIRAALALRGMTQADLARSMGVPALWISRRLSPRSVRPVSLNLDELERIGEILEIGLPALFGLEDLRWPLEDRVSREVSETHGLRPVLRLVS